MVWHKFGERILVLFITELLSDAQRIRSWGASRYSSIIWVLGFTFQIMAEVMFFQVVLGTLD